MAGTTKLQIKYYCTNDHTRAEGLMNKPSLNDDECAFFVFPYSHRLSFWNKNVNFDIVVMFFNEKHELKCYKKLKAQQVDPVACPHECKYVIEVGAENFEKMPKIESFYLKDEEVVLVNKDIGKNFENQGFQKIANSFYKTIR